MGLFHTALVILAGTLLLLGGFVLATTELIKDTRVKRGIRWMGLFILGLLIGWNIGTVLFYLALAFALLASILTSLITAFGVTLVVWVPAFLLIYFVSKTLPEQNREWYMGKKMYYLFLVAFMLTANLVGIPFAIPISNFVIRMTVPLALHIYTFFDLNIGWVAGLL